MSTTAKSKPKVSKGTADAPVVPGGADRPETIVEEQENESMSIQETSTSRMSRHQRTGGMRDKTVANVTQQRLENTYKLKPDIPFRSGRVDEKINQILSTKLTDFVYSPDKAPHITMELSSSVKAAVKQLKMSRHKLVVLVTMFPVANDCRPSAVYASRCLWNTETDSSTSVVYTTRTATVVVLVFGLYYD